HTSCARKSDNTVWCWGRNNNGQVGKGSASSACGGGGDSCEATPRQVVGITDATFVAMGHKSVCALRSGATKVSCWWHNDAGQFGTGTNTGNNYGPVAASNMPANIVDLAVGHLHACAVTASGDVYCWGDRASGKVGDGLPSGLATPTLVTGLGPASE